MEDGLVWNGLDTSGIGFGLGWATRSEGVDTCSGPGSCIASFAFGGFLFLTLVSGQGWNEIFGSGKLAHRRGLSESCSQFDCSDVPESIDSIACRVKSRASECCFLEIYLALRLGILLSSVDEAECRIMSGVCVTPQYFVLLVTSPENSSVLLICPSLTCF